GYFAEQAGAAIRVRQRAQPLQDRQRVGVQHVVRVVLQAEQLGRQCSVVLDGGVGAQLRVVQQEVDRIQAEAVHAAVEPELRRVQQLLHHGLVAKVQGRLVRQEVVQVVLPTA